MSNYLFPDTMIEIIVTTKNGKYYKMIMTVAEWEKREKKRGFKYQAYQLGFSQFKLETK